MSVPLPASFRSRTVDAGGVQIHTVVGGAGPPVLLLHGYPQTYLIWHEVAPALATEHTVVLTDLRGYGDSGKPPPDTDDVYAKRAMAADQLAVMRALGFERFALDAPDAVRALAVLDIVPTRHIYAHADKEFGLGYYHWFFLAAPNGIPERLLGAEPEFWVRTRMNARHAGGRRPDEAAVREYVRCFADPAAIAASCADRVRCPLLALWGRSSFVGRTYDVLDVWRRYADQVAGHAVASDHYVPEEAPDEVLAALRPFLR